jgi:hypothetical protein
LDYIVLRFLELGNKRKEIGGEIFFRHLFLSNFIFWVGEYFPGFWENGFLLSGAVIFDFQ